MRQIYLTSNFADTFNLKEQSSIQVTKKPPLHSSLQLSASRKTLLKMDSSICRNSDSCDSSPRSSSHDADDDWIVVDPKADNDFISNLRKKIQECVNTKTEEEDDVDSESDLFEAGRQETLDDEDVEAREQEPSRSSIINYILSTSLFNTSSHTLVMMNLVTEYINNVKKRKVLEILDQDQDTEDKIFLISEVLYGNK